MILQPLGLVEGRQSIRLVTTVNEGVQFRVGAIAIKPADNKGALNVAVETLRAQFHLGAGDLFDVSQVRAGLARIRSLYAKRHEGVDVVTQIAADDSQRTINATFPVKEGK